MALWRTETHWYRPIRRTDAARFVEDMRRGWVAVGALEPTMDDVLCDVYADVLTELVKAPSLSLFYREDLPITGRPTVYPIRTR